MTLTEIASAARDTKIARQSQHRTAMELHEQAIRSLPKAFGLTGMGDQQQAASSANMAYSQTQNAMTLQAQSITTDPSPMS